MDTIFGLQNKNQYTLADFMDQSSFDEKFIVNIKENWIRNIYHVQNKYHVPVLEGNFREMYEYAKGNMVDGGDTAFHELLEPDTIMERLEKNAGILKAECRERLIDGTYRWVQYVAITGSENGVEEDLIYFYVFDIQNQKDRQNGNSSTSYSIKNRNHMTGLLIREEFVSAANEMVKKHAGPWCIAAIDIQHFKIFNSWFGKEKGDYVLAQIGSSLLDFEKKDVAVASYFGRDNFAVLLQYDQEKIQELYDMVSDVVHSYSNIVGFLPAFGINILQDNTTIDFDMYDCARMAVEEAKRSYTNRIAYFDSKKYDARKNEYLLLTHFKDAIKNKQIQFYLQPQCSIVTGKIVGAEALVRWIQEDGSIMQPSSFIPFLETSGFIVELDKTVWESVCIFLREMLDAGIKPVPISLNVSQVDIFAMDVPAYLYGLTQRYHVPLRLLKVEITESVYMENFEEITSVIKELKDRGFMVMMDDFGSGYSSLNMLDKINVDVIKLDMAFMKDENLTKKGISIVESIISMTKTMNLPLVVEGVENEEQVSFLNKLGCPYAQGYYFYKPMPSEDYIKLVKENDMLDYSGFKMQSTELFHTREFLNESLFTDTILNNILGPVAFYIQDHEGYLDIVRYNQQFYECIADVEMDSRKTHIQDYIFKEDIPELDRMLEKAHSDSVNGGECTIRFFKSGGGEFWYHMHLYFLRDTEQGRLFYGKIQDATEMHQQGTSFYELLKLSADSCLRIDLKDRLIYELDKTKAFDDPSLRVMDVEESLRLTAEMHIPNKEDQDRFVSFFDPDRLIQSREAGIYGETYHTPFYLGSRLMNVQFSAYYIRFLPNQTDSVYIFVNSES